MKEFLDSKCELVCPGYYLQWREGVDGPKGYATPLRVILVNGELWWDPDNKGECFFLITEKEATMGWMRIWEGL